MDFFFTLFLTVKLTCVERLGRLTSPSFYLRFKTFTLISLIFRILTLRPCAVKVKI